MTSNQAYVYESEGQKSPQTDNNHQDASSDKSSLRDAVAGTPSLVRSDWSDTSLAAYRMAKDKPDPVPPQYTSTEVIGPQKDDNKPKMSKRMCILICLIILICITAVITTVAVMYSTSGSLANDQLLSVDCTVVINEDWSPALANTTSAEYNETVSRIAREIEPGTPLYMDNDKLANSMKRGKLSRAFGSIEVKRLRPGSIIVDFIITINLPSDTSEEDGSFMVSVEDSGSKQELTGVIRDSLISNTNLDIDTDRVTVTVSVTLRSTPGLAQSTSPTSRAAVPPTTTQTQGQITANTSEKDIGTTTKAPTTTTTKGPITTAPGAPTKTTSTAAPTKAQTTTSSTTKAPTTTATQDTTTTTPTKASTTTTAPTASTTTTAPTALTTTTANTASTTTTAPTASTTTTANTASTASTTTTATTAPTTATTTKAPTTTTPTKASTTTTTTKAPATTTTTKASTTTTTTKASTTTTTANTVTATTPTTTRPSLTVNINGTTVFGRVILNNTWTSALSDSTSLEYRTLLSRFTAEVSAIFSTSPWQNDLVTADILRLSPGSVIVDFRLVFRDVIILAYDSPPLPGSVNLDDVLEVLQAGQGKLSDDFDWTSSALTVCRLHEHACPLLGARGNVVCISPEFVCDGNPDCPQTTDEQNCSQCTHDQISCDVSRCLPQSARCDGVAQCSDGSDEFQCLHSDSDYGIHVVWGNSVFPLCTSPELTRTLPDGGSLAERICRHLGQGSALQVQPSGTFAQGVLLTSLNWAAPQARSVQSRCETVKIRCQMSVCGQRQLLEPEFYRRGDVPVTFPRPALDAEWPWHRSVFRKGSPACTGIMVSLEWMLDTCFTSPFRWYTEEEFYWNVTSPPFAYYDQRRYPAFTYRIEHAVPVLERNSTHGNLGLVLLTPKTSGTPPTPRPACLPEKDSRLPPLPICYVIGQNVNDVEDHVKTGQQETQITGYKNCSAPDSHLLCAEGDPGCKLTGTSMMCLNLHGFWEVRGMYNFSSQYNADPCAGPKFIDIQPVTQKIRDIIDAECIFKCSESGNCLYDHKYLCDGIADCSDLSDETDTICVTSANCTFEYGDCGYTTQGGRPRQYGRFWNKTRARRDYWVKELPGVDHTTESERGYVMAFLSLHEGWTTLVSPRFDPIPFESCLTFYWFTTTDNPKAVLKILGEIDSSTRLLAQLQAPNYRQGVSLLEYGLNYTWVALDMPAFTTQMFFRAETGNVSQRIGFAVDDIHIQPGYCIHSSVNCSFSGPGLCDYVTLYLDSNWLAQESSTLGYGRHIEFHGTGRNVSYIASPIIRTLQLVGCLSFDYQFDSVYQASLSVYVVKGELAANKVDFTGERLWGVTSSGRSDWQSVHVPLNHDGAASYRVVFEGKGLTTTENVTIRLDNIGRSLYQCPLSDTRTTSRSPTTTTASVESTPSVLISQITLNDTVVFGRVVLNKTWSPALMDTTSPEYNTVLTLFDAEIKLMRTYGKGRLSTNLIRWDIVRLSEGSVVVDYRLVFRGMKIIDFKNQPPLPGALTLADVYGLIDSALFKLSPAFGWQEAEYTVCPPHLLACPLLGDRGNMVCISPNYICDGNPDCPHTTDEHNCSRCRNDQISCDVSRCLPQSARCDGVVQCSDGSDEFHCLYSNDDSTLTVVLENLEFPVCMSPGLTSTLPGSSSLAEKICKRLGRGTLIKVESTGNQVLGVVLSSLNWTEPQARSQPMQCDELRLQCQYPECGRRQMQEPDFYRLQNLPSVSRPSLDTEWPWHASFSRGGAAYCTGVFITPEWVLNTCMNSDQALDKEEVNWKLTYPPFNYHNPTTDEQYEADYSHIVNIVDIASGTPSGHVSLVLVDQQGSTAPPRPVCLPGTDAHLPASPVCYILGQYPISGPAHVMTGQQESQTPGYRNCSNSTHSLLCAAGDSTCQMLSRTLVCLNSHGFWEVSGLDYFQSFPGGETCPSPKFVDVHPLTSKIRQVLETECIFKCTDTGQCLYDYRYLCDGKADCHDQSDEADTLCAQSPNCKFEQGDCGYRVVRPTHMNRPNWEKTRTRGGIASPPIPDRDHTTNSSRGYAMVVRTNEVSWSNLASPEFSPLAQESCLTFFWLSSTRDREKFLVIHARLSGRSRPISQLHYDDFDLASNPAEKDSATFTYVFQTLPAFTDRLFLQMKSGTVDLNRMERLAEALVFAVDDIHLFPGRCIQDYIICSFTEPGLCGYLDPYLEYNWRPQNYHITYQGRHMTFSDQSLSPGYLMSPSLPSNQLTGCLSFDYQITGAYGGTLAVIILRGEVASDKEKFEGERLWSLTSSGQQIWRSVGLTVNLNEGSSHRVVFEGRAGVENTDVIRIDNIRFSQACDQIACGLDEFRCSSTLSCIPKGEQCNSVNDCSDSDLSDETSSGCASSVTCDFDDWSACGYRNSTDSRGVWVRQVDKEPIVLRLAGGLQSASSGSGRVEVFHGGQWGNICDVGVTAATAQVICRSLGYQSFREFRCCLQYGSGTGRYWLHTLRCSGTEGHLSRCTHNPWGEGSCPFSNVLGLECEGEGQATASDPPGGLLTVFSPRSHYTDTADLVSPLFDCLSHPKGCKDACVKIDIDKLPFLHTPLAIFGEDNSGLKTRLWTSWSAFSGTPNTKPVIIAVNNLERLHFRSYFNMLAETSVTINRIEEQQECVPNTGCTDLDPSLLCDGVADCVDGSDEWGPDCSANLSLSCTFDDFHSCGYSGASKLFPWRRGNASEIRKVYGNLDTYRWRLPTGDFKNNRSGIMLYSYPGHCREVLAVNELLFPKVPELAEGGCLRIFHSSAGNFTLTSPQGHLHHFREYVSFSRRTTRVRVPKGTESLSLLVDCLASHLIIDEIQFTAGECPPISTSTDYCLPHGTFLCDNGREIPCEETCARGDNCGDNSDEKNCRCLSNTVSCGGVCRMASAFCDGKVDCPDGSDEYLDCSCPEGASYTCTSDGHQSCQDVYLYCPSYEGIRCDEEKDCCRAEECCGGPNISFQCGSGECISQHRRCDYLLDCEDFTDEMNCTCRGHDFICPNSGVCIKPQLVCDGTQHCPDGEDEGLQCFNCDTETEFMCAMSGLCILKELVCNGFPECSDRSDELNCSRCAAEGFQCKTTKACIQNFQVCNSNFDCLGDGVDDISDEIGCECSSYETRCGNGVCVASEYWCDGINHCHDNSDEIDCAQCAAHRWRCNNGRCIHLEFRCDGYVDCEDGSDENNCLQCPAGQVSSCRTRRCLEVSYLCDSAAHCEDGGDELHCGSLRSGNESQGLVYFNRSGVQYPLCADNVITDSQVLRRICYYMFAGSFISVQSVFLSRSPAFLIYSNTSDSGDPITSALSLGACTSGSMVRLTCQKPACGTRTQSGQGAAPLVIGGDKSTSGEWPWMAELIHLGDHVCGASIINDRWVVTAAHCLKSTSYPFPRVASYLSVVVGSTRSKSLTGRSQLRSIEKIILHDYSDLDIGFQLAIRDIALLKLRQPLDLSGSEVRPICLADQGVPPPISSVCHVAGWGMTIPYQEGSRSLDLQHVRVALVSSSQCEEDWGQSFNSSHGLICAGFAADATGSCHGDSGGPLMCLDPLGYWRLQGIVSFGENLCGSNPLTGSYRAGVYTRVSAYRDWIDQNIRDNS